MDNHIEINPYALASMKQRDPEERIYMINLLKFRDTVKEGLGVDGRKGCHVWMNKYGAEWSALNKEFFADPSGEIINASLRHDIFS